MNKCNKVVNKVEVKFLKRSFKCSVEFSGMRDRFVV